MCKVYQSFYIMYIGICLNIGYAIFASLSGVGIGMVVVSFMVSVYYNMVLAWVLFYLFASAQSPLPWTSCDNPWNTPGRDVIHTSENMNLQICKQTNTN